MASYPAVGGHHDLPAGGREDGAIVITERERVPSTARREFATKRRLGCGADFCGLPGAANAEQPVLDAENGRLERSLKLSDDRRPRLSRMLSAGRDETHVCPLGAVTTLCTVSRASLCTVSRASLRRAGPDGLDVAAGAGAGDEGTGAVGDWP